MGVNLLGQCCRSVHVKGWVFGSLISKCVNKTCWSSHPDPTIPWTIFSTTYTNISITLWAWLISVTLKTFHIPINRLNTLVSSLFQLTDRYWAKTQKTCLGKKKVPHEFQIILKLMYLKPLLELWFCYRGTLTMLRASLLSLSRGILSRTSLHSKILLKEQNRQYLKPTAITYNCEKY